MNRQHQRGYQGVRSDRYSGSKVSNWMSFQPWHGAIDQILKRHRDELELERTEALVVVEPAHVDFVQPVSETDIRNTLARVPDDYLEDLGGVFVLAGSKKQAKVAKRLFCYGTYWLGCIFLAPYPKHRMCLCYSKPPRPAILREFVRAGVQVRESTKGLEVVFDETSLRAFYLHDVLMHEIGHHVDRKSRKSRRKSEGFAEWFASEFGYRLRQAI